MSEIKYLARLKPENYEYLKQLAEEHGVSMNGMLNMLLSQGRKLETGLNTKENKEQEN